MIPLGPSRSNLSVLVSDHASLELSLPLRSSSCIGSLLFLAGLANLGFFFLVMGTTFLDSSPSLQSLACLEASFSTRSMCKFGLSLSVFDSLSLDLLFPLQNPARLGVLLPAMGLARPDSTSFVLGETDMASPLPLRCSSHPGAFLLTADLAVPGPLLALQSFAQLDSSLAIVGTGLGSLLPPLGSAQTGSIPPLRSLGCFGSVMPALDSTHPEASFFLHKLSHLGLMLPVSGLSCLGLTVPSLDLIQFDSLVVLQSLSRTDASMPVLEFTHSGLLLLPKSHSCSELLFFSFGMSRLGVMLLVLEFSSVGSSLLLKSFE